MFRLVTVLATLMYTAVSVGQQLPAQSLATEYSFTIEAAITAAVEMGPSVDGTRRSIPITGGTVKGDNITAEVLPGGADYQVTYANGATLLRAVYMIRTTDGALINVVNEGHIVPPGLLGNAALYFRTSPRFTAPTGKYDWLNHTVFISAIRLDPAKPRIVIIDVYKVL
jgi:Protein of unknown function (DUF3237)